jgi:hypothetical protein
MNNCWKAGAVAEVLVDLVRLLLPVPHLFKLRQLVKLL